jgi:hypothetical protein
VIFVNPEMQLSREDCSNSSRKQLLRPARCRWMTVQSSEGSNDSHPAETEKSFDALECSVVDCEGSLNPIQTVCQRETKVREFWCDLLSQERKSIQQPARKNGYPSRCSLPPDSGIPYTLNSCDAAQFIQWPALGPFDCTGSVTLSVQLNAAVKPAGQVAHRLCGVGQKLNSKDAATSD